MTDYLELALEELEEQEAEDGALGTEQGVSPARARRNRRDMGPQEGGEDSAEVALRREGGPLGAGALAAALSAVPEGRAVDDAAVAGVRRGGGMDAAGLTGGGGRSYGAEPRSARGLRPDDGVQAEVPGKALVRSAVVRNRGEARLGALPPARRAAEAVQAAEALGRRETRRGEADMRYGRAGPWAVPGDTLTAPRRAGDASAVYERLQRGTRSLDWVQRRPGQASAPAAEQRTVQSDPAALDLIFQRDARRYGGAFTLY